MDRVSRLLNNCGELADDVDDKVQWLNDVISKTAEMNNAVTEMQEWLPGVEATVKDLEPVSSDLNVIEEQTKEVEVRWGFWGTELRSGVLNMLFRHD